MMQSYKVYIASEIIFGPFTAKSLLSQSNDQYVVLLVGFAVSETTTSYQTLD